MTEKTATQGPKVVVLAYDGLCTFEFGICVEVFGLSRPEFGTHWYRFQVAAVEDGPFYATGGIQVAAPNATEQLETADLILIPGWRGIEAEVPAKLATALQIAYNNGARIASICSGVFVLAAAGLLRHKRATTHWRYVEQLRRTEPTVTVEADVLYIDEGQILTSAGSAAGLDLCLYLVRQDFGVKWANMVARRLVLPAHRSGGQAQFIPRPIGGNADSTVAPLLDLVRQRLDENWDIAKLAGLAGMSSRTLQRRFKDNTGESPGVWLVRERLALARDLLETTDQKIDQVAMRAGFGSSETFRHHFRQNFETSPNAYRANFRQNV